MDKQINEDKLRKLAEKIGINWKKVNYSPSDLKKGYKVELEHGTVDKQTNITDDDPIKTIKIALAHLKERGDYYQKLEKLEK